MQRPIGWALPLSVPTSSTASRNSWPSLYRPSRSCSSCMRPCRLACRLAKGASMRPRPKDRGNCGTTSCFKAATKRSRPAWPVRISFNEAATKRSRKQEASKAGLSGASMRPRPKDRGNLGRNQRASMRPRPKDRGNRSIRIRPLRFNEARRSRKHAQPARPAIGFNEAATKRSRKPPARSTLGSSRGLQ